MPSVSPTCLVSFCSDSSKIEAMDRIHMNRLQTGMSKTPCCPMEADCMLETVSVKYPYVSLNISKLLCNLDGKTLSNILCTAESLDNLGIHCLETFTTPRVFPVHLVN